MPLRPPHGSEWEDDYRTLLVAAGVLGEEVERVLKHNLATTCRWHPTTPAKVTSLEPPRSAPLKTPTLALPPASRARSGRRHNVLPFCCREAVSRNGLLSADHGVHEPAASVTAAHLVPLAVDVDVSPTEPR